MLAGKGLADAEHMHLLQLLQSLPAGHRERSLLPFLEGEARPQSPGKLFALPGNLQMLSCLSGTAPASVFMRPAVFANIRLLIQVSNDKQTLLKNGDVDVLGSCAALIDCDGRALQCSSEQFRWEWHIV